MVLLRTISLINMTTMMMEIWTGVHFRTMARASWSKKPKP